MQKKENLNQKNLNPNKLSKCLLNCLKDREKDVINRRYALNGGSKETLESIGQLYSITRERVRQIEKASLKKIKRLKDHKKVLQDLIDEIDSLLTSFGGILAHHHLIDELLAGIKRDLDQINQSVRNHLNFLLEEFAVDFFHFKSETPDYHNAWSQKKSHFENLKQVLSRIEQSLEKKKKPVSAKILAKHLQKPVDAVYSYLHLSKKISQDPFGAWGISQWPEVSPRRMADRVYVILKKYQEPLHYRDIAAYIERHYNKKTHPPTVHNELIADPRFVLVGRGIYGLTEWGYISGTVQDVVEKILAQEKKPLDRDTIEKKVKEHRLVARSTILLALNKSKKIKKIGKDEYQIKISN